MLRDFAIFLLYVDFKENLVLLFKKHFGERLRIGKNGKRKPPIKAVYVGEFPCDQNPCFYGRKKPTSLC